MAKRRQKNVENSTSENTKPRKRRLSQTDVPRVSLQKALRIPRAISDSYANSPTKPLRVAEALDMTVTSGGFRDLCGASIAYGLTEGGYNADHIVLTPLGRRIVAPTQEGDDRAAMREASLNPRIVKEFLEKYNDAKLPSDKIAHNVLEEMHVPREAAERTLQLILDIANEMGFIREIKGNSYVDLDTTAAPAIEEPAEDQDEDLEEEQGTDDSALETPSKLSVLRPDAQNNNRVFITHGKNKDIVSQLKELLTFGSFEPIVAVDVETVSKPVPDKVMDSMRSCYAAIIHVGTELKVMDSSGTEHTMLNSNVLIEIGAAMALYGGKFILLVEEGVNLPSNLQGLYQVRYSGDKLDYEATMKLLRAFNDFKA